MGCSGDVDALWPLPVIRAVQAFKVARKNTDVKRAFPFRFLVKQCVHMVGGFASKVGMLTINGCHQPTPRAVPSELSFSRSVGFTCFRLWSIAS